MLLLLSAQLGCSSRGLSRQRFFALRIEQSDRRLMLAFYLWHRAAADHCSFSANLRP